MQKISAGKLHFEPPFTSLDHLVGAPQERSRDRQAERLGGGQIHDEIEPGRLLDRDVARLRATQNLVDIVTGAAEQVGKICSIVCQARLPASSVCWADSPVTLPPGRAREATRPVPTGSAAAAKTIGMVDVSCFAARTIGTAYVTIISTLSRTNSDANTAKRSGRPSARRYSTVMLRPSIQPKSRSRCKKAATQWPRSE